MGDSYISKELRRDYTKGAFNKNTAEKSPFKQFGKWFQDAVEVKMLDPNAMVLATATKDCHPSARVVLLKKYSDEGFVFFTNYSSRKGREIAENANVALLFFWDKLERQVRIEGKLEKISPEESKEYFDTRPYTSRIGAWASEQSSELKSRFTLMRKVAQLMLKFKKDVDLPDFWGGYILKPRRFEFWQGRANRLHDRLQYDLSDNEWNVKRLYP